MSASGMFEKSASTPQTLSVIGETLVFKGDLTAEEDLLIQGNVSGSILHRAQNLTIGASGNVQADITAQHVLIQGKVQGDVRASESIVVAASARVEGNLFAPTIGLKEGAKFKGSIDMDPGAWEKQPPKSSSSGASQQPQSQGQSQAEQSKSASSQSDSSQSDSSQSDSLQSDSLQSDSSQSDSSQSGASQSGASQSQSRSSAQSQQRSTTTSKKKSSTRKAAKAAQSEASQDQDGASGKELSDAKVDDILE
ncbi:MAG TPA: polymer-forming cytoskeletal protein, partial [Gammaproteobacteria bacterium]|nr:polymer-forming cytoskeletal protein [Gammaproteobacteria bacterium]